jgi:predicted nucleotidyltransferase
MHFSVNELKRCLITLHLSLNDLLRRSVDLMRSAYIPIIIRQELFEEIETVIKSFYPDLAFSELPSFQKLR